MPIKTIYAHIACSDLSNSTEWYAKLFGRKPDALPMPGLAEWHYGEAAGIQLFEEKPHAGASTLTLGVTDLDGEHARFEKNGLQPGDLEDAKQFKIFRTRDPDGNLVVLAGPKS